VKNLANIKSAKKRIRVIARRQARNKHIKSTTKTAVKKVTAAINVGDKNAMQTALRNAISAIDKAATKGVYHKKTASRKISRLTKMLNAKAM